MSEEKEINEMTPAEEVTEEAVQETAEAVVTEEAVEEAAEAVKKEKKEEKTPKAAKEAAPKGKSNKLALILIIALAVVAIAAVVLAFVLPKGGDENGDAIKTIFGQEAYLGDETGFGTTAVTDVESYSILEASPDDVNMNTVVGRDKDGEYFLTNGELQIMYWMEYYEFMQSYGSYASLFGLDSTLPLGQQNSIDTDKTWEQMFLDTALQKFAEIRALYREAQANGYVLDEETQAIVEDILDPEGDFAKEAQGMGYEDTDDYVEGSFGKGANAQDYHNYVLTYYTAMNYYQDEIYAKVEAAVTDADIEAYYDENRASYEEENVMKVNNINIRHILIQPTMTDDNGEYTEEAWTAALEEAERIYALWQENPTEDNFAALAKEHSVDGSAEVGGLYEDVVTGQMVTEFNDWCFDANRQKGDHGIVKTPYGYHIMYFSGVAESRGWFDKASEDLIGSKVEAEIDALAEKYPVEYNYNNIKLYDLISALVVDTEKDAG